MIKIVKGPPPAELLAAAANITEKHKAAFDADPDGYNSGTKAFKFPLDYKSKEVVAALRAAQNNKCCFSEATFSGDFRNVEHYRPKGRIDGYQAKWKRYPGYYWLAYDFDNLLLCKELINISFKKCYFPLQDEGARMVNHHSPQTESPLLIDPSVDEPRDHIRFHREEPVSLTTRGALTIELLNLQHPDFDEDRRSHLALLEAAKEVIDIGIAQGDDINDPKFAKTLQSLRQAVLPSAKFSSMAIDFLSGWPHL